ncbi:MULTISPECIES: hypothetical protein [Pantoea]|uniref:hypothetical protein n=1 Tax=Pantoea TaxID=53335 RepID=UPI0025963811|nr:MULTISPECIES: hypothetical protein [Pantoea]
MVNNYTNLKKDAELSAYLARIAEEDRRREYLRQQAYKNVKATADQLRAQPVEPSYYYQNSTGGRVGISSLPIALY